jgi:hypothetical protein
LDVRSAGFGELGRKIIDRGVTVVAHDESPVGVEHAETFGHIAQGGFEAKLLLAPQPYGFRLKWRSAHVEALRWSA